MNDRLGFKILEEFRHASDRVPNRPAVSMQEITVDSAEAISFQLYQDSTRVTLEVTDNEKGTTFERRDTYHFFGLRGMQERASRQGGHFHIVGTPGIGTTALASVPVVECFTS